jgi:hypothetical protein
MLCHLPLCLLFTGESRWSESILLLVLLLVLFLLVNISTSAGYASAPARRTR